MAPLMTARQVAERWQCSPEHVQRLAKRGLLSGMRLGDRPWRFTPEAVAAYETAHTTTSAETVQPASRATSPARPTAVEIGGEYDAVFAGDVPWRRSVLPDAASPAARRGGSAPKKKAALTGR